MKKVFLCLAAGMFLVSGICLAASVDPSKIVVPKDSGRIVEVYKSENANAPLIAYVQDIHMNYESQKAEAAILETLIRDYGFDIVFVEATPNGGDKDFKFMREKAPKDIRIKTAESLVKDGTFDCVNYLDLATDYNFKVLGVEDMTVYKQQTEDQLAMYDKQADMIKLVSTLQGVVSNLKLHIYTKEQRDLDEKTAAYNKDEIGLVEYVKALSGMAAANNIDIKGYPNATLFADSANLEGQIDFVAVEKERTAAVDAIEKALTDAKAKEELTAKGLKFRTGDISQGEYYTYIKDTAAAAKTDLSASKNLSAYTQYITTYEKIDTNVLFKELDRLAAKLREVMLKTPEQIKLGQIDKGLAILSGMVNIKLVPDEYDYYIQKKAEFDLDGWLAFMKENSAKFSLTNPVPDDAAVLKANLPTVERFYAVAFDRDKLFVANMKAGLSAANKDKAAFVAGGFHTPDVKKLLKESGFSYIIIAPKVDIVRNYDEVYRKARQADVENINAILKGMQEAGKK